MPLKIKPVKSAYSDEQLTTYLTRMGLTDVKGHPTLPNLHRILRGHLITFPFENTEMHYTKTGQIDVDPRAIFNRMLVDKVGGGFCYEQNNLLLNMLLAVGYRGYGIVARTNVAPADEDLSLWIIGHVAALVQVPDDNDFKTYLVDAGFGIGTCRPIVLEDGAEAQGAFPFVKHRLIKATNPNTSLDLSEPESVTVASEWVVQVNQGRMGNTLEPGHWRTLYHFSTAEFYQKDFTSLSFMISNLPVANILWEKVAAVLYLPEANSEDDLGMRILFGDKLTERTSAGFKLVESFETEDQRIKALDVYFGIKYPTEAASFIARTNAGLTVNEDVHQARLQILEV